MDSTLIPLSRDALAGARPAAGAALSGAHAQAQAQADRHEQAVRGEVAALTDSEGRVFLSGTQALVRLLALQAAIDHAAHRTTAGFVSGYRGSPLGGLDKQLWRSRRPLEALGVRFLPAINEELAATAVLGTQRMADDDQRQVDGVYALWYGKGPGLDRAGDALRHGQAYGAAPLGGVLVVVGDDHGCVSSSMSHQSDFAMMAWQMPVVHASDIREMLEFGLYGWALSRYSGSWVGYKTISETVESSSSVSLQDVRLSWPTPQGHVFPATGVHNRWPDLPGMALEGRLQAKLDAVRHYAAHNSIDRWVVTCAQARVAIVTCGKAHLDAMAAFKLLGLGVNELQALGVRLYKVGLVFPLEPQRIHQLVDGVQHLLVIEEKGPVVENQIKQMLYHRAGARVEVLGKTDEVGRPLLSGVEELRPSRLVAVLQAWLVQYVPGMAAAALPLAHPGQMVLSNAADGVRRVPYFCSGCPHNVSTRVPAGSLAKAGIGCHFMASWMDRQTSGLVQMGGEGADWVAQALYSHREHVFQNLGDGTYFHSGVLALRQALAAGTRVTYKILVNDAVAMTGGQPLDGALPLHKLAQQVRAEGVRRIAVVSDAPRDLRRQARRFPAGTSFHHRDELDAVQCELRALEGVTVLLYHQACAAEARRKRKKGELPPLRLRLHINEEVCEGCGDCSLQSNCLSVVDHETALGRKRRIDQSSCNQDRACLSGACPSFVTLDGAQPRRSRIDPQTWGQLLERMQGLATPATVRGPEQCWSILVAGVGGTGTVTLGTLIALAAHMEGQQASALDFTGFAQKGGPVLCHVQIAPAGQALAQVRVDQGQADLLIACDLVVAASAEPLQCIRRGHTQVVLNRHAVQTVEHLRDPQAQSHADGLLDKLRHACGGPEQAGCDAHELAEWALGDTLMANLILLGLAWQKGWVPVGLDSLTAALAQMGLGGEPNRQALALGRLVAADEELLAELRQAERRRQPLGAGLQMPDALQGDLDELIAAHERLLRDHGGGRRARRYRRLVDEVRLRERSVMGESTLVLTRTVANAYAKLLRVKDVYEVARLYCAPSFRASLIAAFEGEPGRDYKLTFHFSPPVLHRGWAQPRLLALGGWLWPLLQALAGLRWLRDTPLDPFGYTAERRLEDEAARDYAASMREMVASMRSDQLELLRAFAQLPLSVRGYGHIKLRNLAQSKVREQRLAAQLGTQARHGPRTSLLLRAAHRAGQLLRDIPVVTERGGSR